jgi:hypothetical protein
MTKTKPLIEDSLISRLVPDPADIPNVRMYVGLLGKSLRKGYWRLYTSPQLTEFVEIREEDIVHAEQMDAAQAMPRGTAAWIKADAQLIRTQMGARQVQTDFLSGDIARMHLGGTQVGGLGWSTWWLTLTTLACVVVVSTICSVDCDTRGASSGTNSCCMCA